MAALKQNALDILAYLKDHDDEDIIAADIAESLGIEVKSVNGTVTALDRHRKLVERVPGEIELEDGTHKAVKFIRLTDAGKSFDPVTDNK